MLNLTLICVNRQSVLTQAQRRWAHRRSGTHQSAMRQRTESWAAAPKQHQSNRLDATAASQRGIRQYLANWPVDEIGTSPASSHSWLAFLDRGSSRIRR